MADISDWPEPTVSWTELRAIALRYLEDETFNPTPEEIAGWMEDARRHGEREIAATARHHGDLVYYMRLGNRIKIGTTTNLRGRLSSLQPEELLGTEAGDASLERERHRMFAHLRVCGEWFRDDPSLRAHIARVCD